MGRLSVEQANTLRILAPSAARARADAKSATLVAAAAAGAGASALAVVQRALGSSVEEGMAQVQVQDDIAEEAEEAEGAFLMGGAVVALCVCGADAVARCHAVLGPDDPAVRIF